MRFEIVDEITNVEVIAAGSSIYILPILRERFGDGRWRKLKGVALVRLSDGSMRKDDKNQKVPRLGLWLLLNDLRNLLSVSKPTILIC